MDNFRYFNVTIRGLAPGLLMSNTVAAGGTSRFSVPTDGQAAWLAPAPRMVADDRGGTPPLQGRWRPQAWRR
jgi:hypothetical protein